MLCLNQWNSDIFQSEGKQILKHGTPQLLYVDDTNAAMILLYFMMILNLSSYADSSSLHADALKL